MEELKKNLQEKAETYIEATKNSINRLIEEAFFKDQGFKQKSMLGEYVFDMDKFRQSSIFKAVAAKQITEIFKEYKPTEEDLAHFTELYKKEYRENMGYVVRRLASEQMEKDARTILDTIKIDTEKIITDFLKRNP